MESIKELREYGHDCCARIDDAIKELADEIEVEHDIELNRQYNRGYNTGYDVGFASADDWLADNEDALVEHGWVKLPKDANGEYIRIGDVMENLREDLEPQLHHTFQVYGIHFRDCEHGCSLTEYGYPTILYRANECRHHHETTVESVLREMLSEIGEGGVYAEDVLLAKYAPKLRLAGDGE